MLQEMIMKIFLKNILSLETGLSISLNYHYKFLVLLPLEADHKLEALKHYFGITHGGVVVTRAGNTVYDNEKYLELCLNAAQTVLGYFRFALTIYGNGLNNNKRRKWWEELKDERMKDSETETSTA
jgi:hypothetical protein